MKTIQQRYLVNATVEDEGEFDPIVLRDAIISGIEIQRDHGNLTTLEDETTKITYLAVSPLIRADRPVLLGKKFDLFVRAYSTIDDQKHPAFAHVTLHQGLVDQIHDLAEVVVMADLAYAHVWQYPRWEEGMRLDSSRLVVGPRDFQWQAEDNAYYPIETVAISFQQLAQDIAEAIKAERSVIFVDFPDGTADVRQRCLRTIACIRVEYDPTFFGGDYSGVGSMAYIPVSVILEHHGDVAKAFTSVTKVDAVHIIHFSAHENYSPDGEVLEESDEDPSSDN